MLILTLLLATREICKVAMCGLKRVLSYSGCVPKEHVCQTIKVDNVHCIVIYLLLIRLFLDYLYGFPY